MANGFIYGNVILRDLLRAAPFAKVTIYKKGTSDKASLFSQDDQNVAILNPLTTDKNGLFGCFVESGQQFDAVASLSGLTNEQLITSINLSSGAVSGRGFLTANTGNSYSEIIKPPKYLTYDYLVFKASGSDSLVTDTPGPVIPPTVDHDLYGSYSNTTGEYTAPGTTNHFIYIDANFTLTNPISSVSGTVYLQKYVSGWAPIDTLAILSETAGNVASETIQYSQTIALNAGNKLRIYFDFSDSAGSDSAGATVTEFSAISRAI